jgi:GPH family glycoside/pentoside/hexuronide:cation symporter
LLYFNLSMRGGMTLYYFRYYIGREDLFGWFNGIGLLVTIAGVWLSRPLAARFGQRTVFRACLALTALFTAMFEFVPPNAILLLFFVQIGLQLSIGPTIPILWAMMASVADFSELRTGRRATAMTFAATMFAFKIGQSVGLWTTGKLLDHFGYVPNVAQSPETLHAIVLMFGMIPAIIYVLGLVVLMFYGIDRRLEVDIQQALSEREAAQLP